METMSQLNQLYMPKKTIHILLPVVCVLSFVLVSYSSVFLPLPLPLPLLSTFSINLFSYSSERNYIFLLCNGILVFLIKNSALVSNSAQVADHIKCSTHVEQTRDEVEEEEKEEKEEEEEEKKRAQHEFLVSVSDNENSYSCDENEEKKQEHLLDVHEDDNYCNDDEEGEEGEAEEEEEDEEREELNKRCEEFIRRMKQNIKIEATRQLILSN